MSFLPIVERELRTAARKRSTYRTRMWFVLVTSLMAGVLVLVGDQTSAKQMGNAVFRGLATLAFVYCLLAGARYAADSLSEEKRDGTLGLLFLTDLRGYDIVLGKLVAVSARTFQGLFAFFPVLAIGLVLGGITSGEFWRAAAFLSNALFFSLCVSLWMSSLSRTAHVALAASVSLLLFLTLGAPGVDWLLSKVWSKNPEILRFASPAGAAGLASDLAYRLSPGLFWQGLLLNHVLGWCFLVLASVAVPQSWQERPIRSEVALGRSLDSSRASDPERAALRTRLLDINPILWLAARNQGGAWVIWGIVTAVALAGSLVLVFSQWIGGSSFGLTSLLNTGLRLVLKLWVAWHACATLAEAQRTGAVELLLATPLRIEEIIRGHWQALQRTFLWPVAAALLLSLLPAIEAFARETPSPSNLFFFPIPAVTLFGMATFVFDLVALAWVGMWMGLSQPKLIQAYGKTVVFVMIVPMLVFCFPNILFDLFWISWARRKLEHSFRQAATDRYTPATQRTDAFQPPAAPSAIPPIISRESV